MAQTEQDDGGYEARPSPCTPPDLAVYHGTTETSGRHKLRIAKKAKYGRGLIFACSPSGKWNLLTDDKSTALHISSETLHLVEALDCIDHKTRKPMRFFGFVEAEHVSDSSISVASLDTEPGSATARAEVQAVASIASGEGSDVTRNEVFEKKLAHFMSLSSQGIDPTLKMPFIKAYLGKSHSTVYREIARGKFPPPIRHGKAVSWFLSQIEAYRLGTWVNAIDTTAGGANAHQTAPGAAKASVAVESRQCRLALSKRGSTTSPTSVGGVQRIDMSRSEDRNNRDMP